MPSRSFHHKSRHGCSNCKQRRKRCDLRWPTCGACARRREICVYDQALRSTITPNPFTQPIIRTLATEWATVEPSVQEILLLQIPHVDFDDVEMIYRFMTRDPTTLDNMPGIFGIRHLNLVKRIPDYPYLLYGLITAAALHSKHVSGSANRQNVISLERKACSFYNLTLAAYRSRLSTLDETTCYSIFSFSVIIAGLAFGLLRLDIERNQGTGQDYLEGVANIFDLLLGAVAVADASKAWLPNPVAEEPLMLPIRSPREHHFVLLATEGHYHLGLLPPQIHAAHLAETYTNPQENPADISAVYETAIPELFNLFFCLQRPVPNDILSIVGWPAFVGRGFVSLLRQGHPAALVVLAYYGVALQTLDHIWWLGNVGSGILRSVAEVVNRQNSEDWKRLLHWPMLKLQQPEIGMHPDQAMHRLPFENIDNQTRARQDLKPFEISLVIIGKEGASPR